jgi:MscS family membrane protein
VLEELRVTVSPLWEYFGDNRFVRAMVVIVFSFIVAWIFDRVIITTLKKLADKTKFELDNDLFDLLHSPIYYSLLLLGFSNAWLIISPPVAYSAIGFSLIKSLVLIVWASFLLRSSRALFLGLAQYENRFRVVHQQTLPLFLNMINIFIVVMMVYLIFSAWHVDMTAWLASAGIVGIAVGFAAKDTLANLFSGVFIMADAPYKIGDFIVLDTLERGEVTHIGIRSTRILTRDDVEVTIPNSVIGNTKITNESGGPNEKYRCRIPVGVAYGSDIAKVREILMAIAEAESNVCIRPEHRVRLRKFGPSSLDFELLVWIERPVLRGRVVDTLLSDIYQQFIEHHIEIPYSKHDLYIKDLPAKD